MKDSARPEFWDERFAARITPWDFGEVPPDLEAWLAVPRGRMRILVPGCGSAYEARHMAQLGHDVTAIDFADAALAAALKVMGPFSDSLVKADFFDFQPAVFDVVYERAFLCALPRRIWPRWAARVGELLRPGGELAGFFYLDDNERGPPFGISKVQLAQLLGSFELQEEQAIPESESIAVFKGKEVWQAWKRPL